MKKLSMIIMVIVFVVFSAFSVKAADCEHYWNDLVDQSFVITIDDIDYILYFGDSVYGPCPGGIAVLSYIEYAAYFEFDCSYTTTADIVIVEGLDFILFEGKLILLPDDPLILDIVEKE